VARRQRSADRQSLPGTRIIRDLSPPVTQVPDGAGLPAVGCVRPNPRTIKRGLEMDVYPRELVLRAPCALLSRIINGETA
jgi:hypothetical protein